MPSLRPAAVAGLFYPADPAQHATFQQIATEVMPQLRAAYAT